MKMKWLATILFVGLSLQPLWIIADQPKPEDFNNFPIPTRGTEKDPKLVYEKEHKDGTTTKLTTSERETSMLVVGGVTVGLTLIAVVGAGILSGKINLTEIARSVWGSDNSSKE